MDGSWRAHKDLHSLTPPPGTVLPTTSLLRMETLGTMTTHSPSHGSWLHAFAMCSLSLQLKVPPPEGPPSLSGCSSRRTAHPPTYPPVPPGTLALIPYASVCKRHGYGGSQNTSPLEHGSFLSIFYPFHLTKCLIHKTQIKGRLSWAELCGTSWPIPVQLD